MSVTEQAPAVGRRPFRVSRAVGSYGELLVVTLPVFVFSGLAWGSWRPALTGTIAEGGGIEITDPVMLNGNAEFATFGVMVLAFLVLGAMVATYAARRCRSVVGVWLMLWGCGCTAVGSLAFYLAGTKLALWRVGFPDVDALHVGSVITYVPEVSPGVSLLVAPFVFSLTLWWAEVFGGVRT